ncbi:MAG: hypothetical protein V8R91_06270 [Butyricimonas faecihominis]
MLDGIILTEDDMGEINMTDLNGDDAAYLVGNAISVELIRMILIRSQC